MLGSRIERGVRCTEAAITRLADATSSSVYSSRSGYIAFKTVLILPIGYKDSKSTNNDKKNCRKFAELLSLLPNGKKTYRKKHSRAIGLVTP